MNEVQKKIAKTSKAVAIILKIGFIFVVIAIVTLLIGIGVLTLANSGVSQSLQDALTVSARGMSAAGTAVDNIVVVLGLAIIQLVVIFMVFFSLYRVFSAISKEHTPFMPANAKRMKLVAILIIAMGVVSHIVEYFVRRLMPIQESSGIDLMWVVMAAFIYCLALIFDYGCQLQRQSDETL